MHVFFLYIFTVNVCGIQNLTFGNFFKLKRCQFIECLRGVGGIKTDVLHILTISSNFSGIYFCNSILIIKHCAKLILQM